ncbi:MAG TPA: UDP-N-acetylmuramoyl-L-alanyl-D-glutamate--2,6-diaminopimelate ligase [Aestuariivirgaceae bacterium]
MSLRSLLGPQMEMAEEVARLEIVGLSADSRQVKPGYLFFAIPGTRADGASYIDEALAKGAKAIVAEPKVRSTRAPVIFDVNPRQRLALAAARFYREQPDLCVAVTGTNGKTSVASFVRQIWQQMGFRSASIGTIGVVGPAGEEYLSHTTPDPVELHAVLAKLKSRDRVSHLSLEASSHGLAQFRLDGVKFAAGAFTNLSRDHLDYHSSFEDYLAAKLRLFEELLPRGSPAVIHIDSSHGQEVLTAAKKHGLVSYTVGVSGKELRLVSRKQEEFGQALQIEGRGVCRTVFLPLAGDFQAFNALVAAGLVIATGGQEDVTLQALESLKGARGRLERVATTMSGATVYVDYAHTPAALETVLSALRPYAKKRLVVVFGCGGDRDKGKRPQMGAVAQRLADVGYVTDDNPRSENPATIRAEIMKAFPQAIEIGSREEAIHSAIKSLQAGDLLVVAGKGHETGQTVGTEVKAFSDHEVVRAATREAGANV